MAVQGGRLKKGQERDIIYRTLCLLVDINLAWLCVCHLSMITLYLHLQVHKILYFASPCFYSSLERTNQTQPPIPSESLLCLHVTAVLRHAGETAVNTSRRMQNYLQLLRPCFYGNGLLSFAICSHATRGH